MCKSTILEIISFEKALRAISRVKNSRTQRDCCTRTGSGCVRRCLAKLWAGRHDQRQHTRGFWAIQVAGSRLVGTIDFAIRCESCLCSLPFTIPAETTTFRPSLFYRSVRLLKAVLRHPVFPRLNCTVACSSQNINLNLWQLHNNRTAAADVGT